MTPVPQKVNVFEAILILCDDIDSAYKMTEAIKDSGNSTAISQRITRINKEVEHLDTFISDVDLSKSFRRSKLKMNVENLDTFLDEIGLTLFDLRKKLSSELYAETFKSFQKIDNAIMTEIGLLISPKFESTAASPQKLSDVEFIQGKRKEGFGTEIDVTNKKVCHYFSVEKEGETRKYEPVAFLDLILECYYNASDSSKTYNEKMSCLVNAKVTLKRYIREHDLSGLGYDFTELFEDLKDMTEQLEANKKLGFFQETSTESNDKDIVKKITTGEDILTLIDQYNVARASHTRHGEKLDIGSIPEMEDLKKSLKKMAKNEDFDSSWFIVNLSRLRQWGTFHTTEAASDAINGFEQLGVKAPFYVQNCYDEIEFRTQYINNLVDQKKYIWTDEEVNSYKEQLTTELKGYSFNKESEVKYLNEAFHKTVKEIKEIEDTVKKEYGYSIQSLYEGGQFKADKSDLNELFFYCEKQKGNVGEVKSILLTLGDYFGNHNKIAILKQLFSERGIQSQKKSKKDTSELTTFESYLFDYDIDKVRALLDRYIKAKPESLAVLSYAFNLDKVTPRASLYKALNKSFQTNYSRQTLSYPFNKCSYVQDSGVQSKIKALKKEIKELTAV